MNAYHKAWVMIVTAIAGVGSLFAACILTGAVFSGIASGFTQLEIQSAATSLVPLGLGVWAYVLAKRIMTKPREGSGNINDIFVLLGIDTVILLWTLVWATTIDEPLVAVQITRWAFLIILFVSIPLVILYRLTGDKWDIDPVRIYLRAIVSTPSKILIFYAVLVAGALIPLAAGESGFTVWHFFWPLGFVDATWQWRSLLFIPFLLVIWICADLHRYLMSPQTIQPLFSSFTISYIIFLRAAEDPFWGALIYGGIYMLYRHLPKCIEARESAIEST